MSNLLLNKSRDGAGVTRKMRKCLERSEYTRYHNLWDAVLRDIYSKNVLKSVISFSALRNCTRGKYTNLKLYH